MSKLKIEDLVVGKEYTFEQIESLVDNINLYSNEYGGSTLGKNAIHITDELDRDIWFILTSATANDYYFQCVYNN